MWTLPQEQPQGAPLPPGRTGLWASFGQGGSLRKCPLDQFTGNASHPVRWTLLWCPRVSQSCDTSPSAPRAPPSPAGSHSGPRPACGSLSPVPAPTTLRAAHCPAHCGHVIEGDAGVCGPMGLRPAPAGNVPGPATSSTGHMLAWDLEFHTLQRVALGASLDTQVVSSCLRSL